MNLSLYQLKKKLKLNKQAQGGLVAVVLAGLVGSILVSSATSWYLSMRNGIWNVEDKLEAQTIAQSEWERLSHMSLDELEAKRGELAEKYSAGTGSQYQISVNLGEKGTFNGGTCGAIGSDGYANCFKDTTITVYRDGNRMFTTRTLPLMAGTYTRKEIDDKFASLLRLEPEDENAKIPEGKALYAYLDGQKLPVSQGGGGGGFPNKKISYYIDFNTPAGEYELFSINRNYNGGSSPQLLTIKQDCWAYVTIKTTTYKRVAGPNGSSVDVSPETDTYWQPLLKGDILTISSEKFNSNHSLLESAFAKYIIYPIEK